MSRCYKQQIVLIQFYCILYLLLTTESLFVLQSVFHVFAYFLSIFVLVGFGCYYQCNRLSIKSSLLKLTHSLQLHLVLRFNDKFAETIKSRCRYNRRHGRDL